MSKIVRKLLEWQQQGLLNAQQVERIQQYENTQPAENRMLRGFVFLGVCVTALGMISLIAANWIEIPDHIKLLCDFLLLSLLAVSAIRYRSYPQPLRYDAILLGFILLAMASIGLIAQIYHTYGHFYSAILLWSAITLPVILTARYVFNTAIWVGLTTVALISYVVAPEHSFFLMAPFTAVFLGCLMITTLACFCLGQIGERWPITQVFSSGFRWWAPFYGLVTLFLVDNAFGAKSLLPSLYSTPLGEFYLLLAICTILAVFMKQDYSPGQKTLLYLLVLQFTLLPFVALIPLDPRFTFACNTILMLTLAALFFGSRGRIDWFNDCIYLIALRFFMIYVQVIGSLASTGLGLIVSGLLLLALATLWTKNKVHLQNWVKRRWQS